MNGVIFFGINLDAFALTVLVNWYILPPKALLLHETIYWSLMQEPFIHHTAVIDAGATIGNGTKIWHFCHIMPTAVIGSNCNIGQNVYIDNHAHLGNGVKIQNNVSVYHGVVLQDDVFVGPSAVFTNVINPRSFIERKNQFRQTLVQKGASIGANATIICGTTIGSYALVGAGAVVTHDVPAYALVTGNPARQRGWVSEAGHKLHFVNNEALCAETGQQYLLQQNKVIKVTE
jgi:UDP-2-acetamido-3-amino-2,3-dideoxy-glucuronate N-acetyltransferase